MVRDLYTREELVNLNEIIYQGSMHHSFLFAPDNLYKSTLSKVNLILDLEGYFKDNPTWLKKEKVVFALELPFHNIPLWVYLDIFTIKNIFKFRLEHGR